MKIHSQNVELWQTHCPFILMRFYLTVETQGGKQFRHLKGSELWNDLVNHWFNQAIKHKTRALKHTKLHPLCVSNIITGFLATYDLTAGQKCVFEIIVISSLNLFSSGSFLLTDFQIWSPSVEPLLQIMKLQYQKGWKKKLCSWNVYSQGGCEGQTCSL